MGDTSGDDPAALFAAGVADLHAGRDAEAAAAFRRLLRLAPGNGAVVANLIAALLRLGRIEEAVAAAAGAPDEAPAQIAAGNAHAAAGNLEAAIRCYEAALRAEPAHLSAAVNLANALSDAGRLDEAAARFDALLARAPDLAPARAGAGLLAQRLGDHAAALALFEAALTQAPDDAAAGHNRAVSLAALGRDEEALAALQAVLHRHPQQVASRLDMAQLLQRLGRHGEAAEAFRAVLECDPSRHDVGLLLRHSLLHLCDWRELPDLEARVTAALRRRLSQGGAPGVSPFALIGLPLTWPEWLQAVRAHARDATADAAALPPHRRRTRGERLRVGWLSPDLRRHSVGFGVLDILGALDPARFESIGYLVGPAGEDEVTEAFRRTLAGFRTPGEDTATAVRAIREDGIDVLVDLAGHTRAAGLSVLAARPAPVQCHWYGYANTLGLEQVDYLLTDARHTPPDLAAGYPERIAWLPDSFMAARPWRGAPAARADCGLPDDAVVLAAFNAPYKIVPALFDAWIRILQRAPEAALWLPDGGPAMRGNVRREAAARGIDPARLLFAPPLPREAHLERLAAADLALDSWPHGGGATTLDALACGVPVVSLQGETPSSRLGLSLLHAAGLPELATRDEEAYVALAVEGGRTVDMRARLATCHDSAPLFDVGRLAAMLGEAFETMWWQWQTGEAPESFEVRGT